MEKKIPDGCIEIPLEEVDYIYQPPQSHTPVIVMKQKLPPMQSRVLECMRCGSKKNLNTNKDKSFVECDKCMWGNGKSEKQPEEVLYEKFDEVVKKHEEYIADDYATYVGNPAVLLEDLRRVLLEYKSVKEKQLKVESEKQEEWYCECGKRVENGEHICDDQYKKKVKTEKQEGWREKLEKFFYEDLGKGDYYIDVSWEDMDELVEKVKYFVGGLLSERTFTKKELKYIESILPVAVWYTNVELVKGIRSKISKLLKEE